MPGMGGLEATQKIKQIKALAHTPIVGLSADAFFDTQQVALENGMSAYITKPIDFQKLIPILTAYLRPTETVAEVQTAKQQTLPPEKEVEVKKLLAALPTFDVMDFGTIFDQLELIRELCQEYDTPYLTWLEGLEKVLFSGDPNEIEQYISTIKKGEI